MYNIKRKISVLPYSVGGRIGMSLDPWGPRMPRWFVNVMMVLAVAVVAMWAVRAFLFVRSGPGGAYYNDGYGWHFGWGMSMMFFPGMLFAAIVMVLLGVGLWWLLNSLFWRKYFPTSAPYPPPPLTRTPQGGSDASSTASSREEELKKRLDALEEALLSGRISEETYRELKEKYERELKSRGF